MFAAGTKRPREEGAMGETMGALGGMLRSTACGSRPRGAARVLLFCGLASGLLLRYTPDCREW